MLRIRFKKVGSRKQPSFRIVVADIRESRDGSFVEDLGHYNPRTNPPTFVVDREKVDSWIGKGAKPSDSLKRMLNLGNNEELYKNVKFTNIKKSKKEAVAEPAAVAEEPAAVEKKSTKAKKSTKNTKSEEA